MVINTIILSNGKPYTVRSNRDRFFFPKEWLAFKKAVRPEYFHVFEVLVNTGSRINEARNIQVNDIDFNNKRLTLRITKVKARKGEKHPRPRIIPISTEFTKYLQKYINQNKIGSVGFILVISTPGANQLLKRGLQRASIQDWQMFSIHNIRKTFEMWLLALGLDSLKVTAHVGHSMQIAAGSYISADVFSHEEKLLIRDIFGDLYMDSLRKY